jgi:c-di-GMP-binding flagellar brake protein YcgR
VAAWQDGEVSAEETPPPGDKRRHARAQVDLQVSLRFSSVQQFLSAHAGDISESGMFIEGGGLGEGFHEIGQVVLLRFDAGRERIVQGKARIVRTDKAGIGLEFVELDESSRKLVEMIVRIKLAAG